MIYGFLYKTYSIIWCIVVYSYPLQKRMFQISV